MDATAEVDEGTFEQALSEARADDDLSRENIAAHLPATPVPVTGLDGKTYTRTATDKPRSAPRRALTEQFFDAAYDLARAVERVHKLTSDDRWENNRAQIATKHEGNLRQAADLMDEVLRCLDTKTPNAPVAAPESR